MIAYFRRWWPTARRDVGLSRPRALLWVIAVGFLRGSWRYPIGHPIREWANRTYDRASGLPRG